MNTTQLLKALSALTLTAALVPAAAQQQELNIYSARHYQADEQLYGGFTKATGIRINRVEAGDAELIARLKAEGTSSPADVIVLVDAARMWRAEIDGLFQPVQSKILEERIPNTLRGKDDGQGSHWYGFSTRARVIVYNKASVNPADVQTYEQLASDKLKGKVCTRSGSHPYNLSLIGSLMEHLGPQKTEAWARSVVENMARPPRGGDTDQIRAVASGECQVAITNSYYLARLMRSDKAVDKAVVAKVGVVFPNQATTGTHVNIAGAGMARNAPNPNAAVRFLEYLASDDAQRYFADGNNEWPAVSSVKVENPALDTMGEFKSETVPISVVGMNQIKVQQMLDRVGYR